MGTTSGVDWDEAPLVSQLVALVHLVREISMARDAEEIYQPALSALDVIVRVDRCAILLLDSDGIARFVGHHGLSDAYRAVAEGHFPWTVDDPAPRPILFADVEKEPSLSPLLATIRREGIRALGFIPLLFRDRLVGKFMLYFDKPHAFSREEVEIASAIGYLVAFAIERTRLYSALEESDRRKDTFLATLAHELRNPLAPVAAAIALMDQRPDDLAVAHKSHEVIRRNVGQIVNLVDDLLDVSRITRGLITIEKKPVELAATVRHAVAAVEPLAAAKHQQLTLSLEPLWLEADSLRLEQVITNLVQNASKYTPNGGHIAVTTRTRNEGVEVVVHDDGIGIDPLMIPRLFDMFVQADRSLARTCGGLGIGLTIVREMVALHGGSVHATSEGEGRGAEFVVFLPGRIEQPRATQPSVPIPAKSPGRRILVVDDNEDVATMLSALLESWGHDVAAVNDGESAIAAVAALRPEIILLDLGLPGMNGFEVAERLRAHGDKQLRIVAVSGYGQPSDIARARAAGFDAHLAKPVDLGALSKLLAKDSGD